MLACARIGAVHSVVFGGFSAESLRDRINDSTCRLLITADGGYRRGQIVALKKVADEAVAGTPSIEHVVVVQRGGGARCPVDDEAGARSLVSRADARRAASRASRSRWTPRTCSTSSTRPARPGSRRASSTRPAATWSARTRRRSSCSICAKTTSTGARPTSAGSPATATSSTVRWRTARRSLMYEGAPDWPQKDRFWSIIEQHGVTVFYTAPTAIRAFMRWGTEWPQKRDLSSLRLLGSVGEPINPEAWIWYYKFIGGERCPGRRHVVADGDRRDHDHAAARRHDAEARIGDEAVPRHRRGDPHRERRQGGGRRRPARADATVAVDAARHLRRSRSLRPPVLEQVGQRRLRHRRRREARRRRLLLAARPRGRRHQRRRSSHRDDGGRERARRSPGASPKRRSSAARTRSRGRRSRRSSR